MTVGPRLTEVVREDVEGQAPVELLFQHPGGGQLTNYWLSPRVSNFMLEDFIDQLPAGPWVHGLRHTYASWLIQAGVPLPVNRRRLAHESITDSSDTYGHLTDNADVLDDLDG